MPPGAGLDYAQRHVIYMYIEGGFQDDLLIPT